MEKLYDKLCEKIENKKNFVIYKNLKSEKIIGFEVITEDNKKNKNKSNISISFFENKWMNYEISYVVKYYVE